MHRGDLKNRHGCNKRNWERLRKKISQIILGSVYCYALFVFRQTRHSENVCRGVRLHVRTLKYLLFLYRSTFTRLINAGNVSRVRIPTTLVAHSPSSKIVLLLNYFSFEAGGEPKATERPRVRPQSRRDAVTQHFSEGITPDVCRVKLGSGTPFRYLI